MNTNDLIEALSKDPQPLALRGPGYYAWRLGLVLALYAAVGIPLQGLRPDLPVQFLRPMFMVEVTLLAVLVATSIMAAVLSMYPDNYQRRGLLTLPYMVFVALAVFIAGQWFLPLDARMAMPKPLAHGIECSLCIATLAMLPSAVIFWLLRKGASVHPWRAGSFAVLASASLGCLMLRMAEQNDSLTHLLHWHYLPTLLFAGLGACFGKYLLRW